MKVIDLLIKIANGEEVKFKIIDEQSEYYCKENDFLRDRNNEETDWWLDSEWLNKEVEIIEEEKEFTKEDFIKEIMGLDGITREQFDERYEVKECNCGMPYCKGFIAKEKKQEKKVIPEKIDVWYDPIKDTKLERHDTDTSIEILAAMCDDLKDKYNGIIDYLHSKGDE